MVAIITGNFVTDDLINVGENDSKNYPNKVTENLKIDVEPNFDNKNIEKISTGCGPSPPRDIKNNDPVKKVTTSTGTSPPPQSASTQVPFLLAVIVMNIIIFLFYSTYNNFLITDPNIILILYEFQSYQCLNINTLDPFYYFRLYRQYYEHQVFVVLILQQSESNTS